MEKIRLSFSSIDILPHEWKTAYLVTTQEPTQPSTVVEWAMSRLGFKSVDTYVFLQVRKHKHSPLLLVNGARTFMMRELNQVGMLISTEGHTRDYILNRMHESMEILEIKNKQPFIERLDWLTV